MVKSTARNGLPRGCTPWFTLETAWSDYRVVFADEKSVPDLAEWFSFTDIENAIIFLNWSLARSRKRLVTALVHEAIHANVSSPGEHHLLARVFGCETKDSEEREEEVAVHLGTKLGDSFLRSGLLVLPPLPKRPK